MSRRNKSLITAVTLLFLFPVAGTGMMDTNRTRLPVTVSISPGARPFDVVINEIMARPSPPAGLPEAAYIELHNRSDRHVNVLNWSIGIGSRYRYLPEHEIEPGGFLIITRSEHKKYFEEFGNVAAVPALPTPDPEGETIVLRDAAGNVISAVDYGTHWYGNELKASGGWSLEQIDPFNPCGGAGNWSASKGSMGGTPGSTNSVRADNPDNTPPELLLAHLLLCGSVRLRFSEPMHPLSGLSNDGYHASGHGRPLLVSPLEPFFDKTDLLFKAGFSADGEYIIRVDKGLYDCAGNFISSSAVEAGLIIPSYPGHNEIVINEILFDPLPGGVTFVEIVNISGKTFDLGDIGLAGIKNGKPDQVNMAGTVSRFFFPGEYAVLTTCPESIRSHYYAPDPGVFVRMDRMPRLYVEKGGIAIVSHHLSIIDDLNYSSGMHSPMLTSTKGVSLERICFEQPSFYRSNWLSASESAGFATPGLKNSQSAPLQSPDESPLSADPGIFSPDNSGHNDVVTISYNLDKPGYIGSITIFDTKGRTVRRLVRNELFGASGSYIWDGRNEANLHPGLGIYLILMELFHPEGVVRQYKKTVVLAGRLR